LVAREFAAPAEFKLSADGRPTLSAKLFDGDPAA